MGDAMRSVSNKKGKLIELPEIPDRYEIAEYLKGRVAPSRRREIERILKSDTPQGEWARTDLNEIRERMKHMPRGKRDLAADKLLIARMRTIMEHKGGPAPGDVWSLRTGKFSGRDLLVLRVNEGFARVAPLSDEHEFAGPRDIVVKDKSYSQLPVLVELFASMWMELEELAKAGRFAGGLSQGILSAARDADMGIYDRLPRGIKRGKLEEPEIEEFHEDWREAELMTFERFRTAAYMSQDSESPSVSDSRRKDTPVLILPMITESNLRYAYGAAAAGSSSRSRELEFWTKVRSLSENAKRGIVLTGTFEAGLAIVDGQLFLTVDLLRSEREPHVKVSEAVLKKGNTLIRTTEKEARFARRPRVHLHFDIPAKSAVTGIWQLDFLVDGVSYSREVDFR
jgi:hypothetical protein